MEMKKYKLSEICKNITDGEHGTVVDSPNGEYFLLSNKNISDGKIFINSLADRRIDKQTFDKINKRTRLEKDDVLISTVGTLGKLCIVESNFIFTVQRSVGIIKPNQEKLISKYLKYLLMSNTYQNLLNNTSKGAVQKCIFIDDLKNLEVSLPSLEIQQKIASVLSSLDDKIALNRRINAKLEQMAKHLYDHWFVQFDFPNADGKPYKASGGKMVYNETLKREIPEEWEVKCLGEICEFRNGINYDKDEIGNKIYKIVNVRNITATSLLMNQNDFDTICLKSSQAENYLIPENAILIARSGSPGATRIIIEVEKNVIFCGFIICMEKFKSVLKTYLAFTLKMFENSSATKTGGSILQNVSQETLKRLPVIIPPIDIISNFNVKTLSFFNYQLSVEKESEKLTKLRDRLLPLLMNGQVEVM